MHMARLYDPAKKFGEYSLASLTQEYERGVRTFIEKYYIRRKKNEYDLRIKNPNSSVDEKK